MIKLLKSAYVPLFAEHKTTTDALEYAHSLLPNEKAAITTAVMVYHNTLIRTLLAEAKAPDLDIIGMDVIERVHETKGERAARLYPNMTIDCAVPQGIIDKLQKRGYSDPAAHLVTVYAPDNKPVFVDGVEDPMATLLSGTVMPIDNVGIHMLACVAINSL